MPSPCSAAPGSELREGDDLVDEPPLEDRVPAEAEAVEADLGQRRGAPRPQVGVGTALHHGEQQGVGRVAVPHQVVEDPPALPGPPLGQLDAVLLVLPGRLGRGAQVERVDDVGAHADLGLDARLGGQLPELLLGREAVLEPVIAELAQAVGGEEREGLEAARVGDDRAVPPGEVVDPAQLGHHRGAGLGGEVGGADEEGLDADGAQLVGADAADHAPGRVGHEDGRADLTRRRREHPGRRPVGFHPPLLRHRTDTVQRGRAEAIAVPCAG